MDSSKIGDKKNGRERNIKCNKKLCNREGNMICTNDPSDRLDEELIQNSLSFLSLFSHKANT